VVVVVWCWCWCWCWRCCIWLPPSTTRGPASALMHSYGCAQPLSRCRVFRIVGGVAHHTLHLSRYYRGSNRQLGAIMAAESRGAELSSKLRQSGMAGPVKQSETLHRTLHQTLLDLSICSSETLPDRTVPRCLVRARRGCDPGGASPPRWRQATESAKKLTVLSR
jgi:hypothetical protein